LLFAVGKFTQNITGREHLLDLIIDANQLRGANNSLRS